MKLQTLLHAALSACAVAALPSLALAKQDAPMVGQAVQRAVGMPESASSSAVVPVVVGSESAPTQSAASSLAEGMAVKGSDTKAQAASDTPVMQPVSASSIPTPPAIERLAIQAGQRLSLALGAWLKSQNIELSWEPAGTLPGRVRDVVIDSAWLASQTSLEPTLTEVLAPFGLTAHVLRQRQTTDASHVTHLDASPTSVVVRNASNARP